MSIRAVGPDGAPDAPGAALVLYWEADRPIGRFWSVDGSAPPLAAVPPAPPRHETPSRSVSVVICSRDRPEALAHCLAALRRQSRMPDELLVVDSASRDGRTREVALAGGARYLREARPGLDIARNEGAGAAAGEIVAYTDDDTEPHPRWIERLVAAFDAPSIDAVAGLVLPAMLETPAQILFERQWGFGRGFVRRDFGPDFYAATRARGCPAWEIGAGANMAFRRCVFERFGGFDERLDVGAAGCSGDSEMWHRILSAGGTCRYEPGAVVLHHHRRDMAGLEAQIRAYMRGHVAALLVQYERTGERGNLHRAFATLPAMYARRAAGRLINGAAPHNRLLRAEVAGAVAGLVYYLLTPRP